MFEKFIDPYLSAGMSPELHFSIYLINSLFLLISIGVLCLSGADHKRRTQDYYGQEVYESFFIYRDSLIKGHAIMVMLYILNPIISLDMSPDNDFQRGIITLVNAFELFMLFICFAVYLFHTFASRTYLSNSILTYSLLVFVVLNVMVLGALNQAQEEVFSNPDLVRNTYGIFYLYLPFMVVVLVFFEVEEMVSGRIPSSTMLSEMSDDYHDLLAAEENALADEDESVHELREGSHRRIRVD